MSTKKFTLSVLTAFILSNVLTTIYYMLTDEANFVPYRKEEINYLGMLLNHLIYAGLMVYLFPFFYAPNPKKGRSFLFGCIIAALMFLPQALVVRSIWKVDFNSIFVLNTIAHLAIGGIMGLAIAFIYNYKSKDVA